MYVFMKIFILFFTLSSLSSNPDAANITSNRIFDDTYLKINERLQAKRKALQEKKTELEHYSPRFTKGTLEYQITNHIGAVKNVTVKFINAIRYGFSELTRSSLEKSINDGIDFLLEQYRQITNYSLGNELPIPGQEVSGFGYWAKVDKGTFSSISSLEKSGRVTVIFDSTYSLLINIPLKLSKVHVFFRDVQVKVLFYMRGTVTATIARNNMTISLRLGMDSPCALEVERILIKDFGGIHVYWGGGSFVGNSFINGILSPIIRGQESSLPSTIQQAIDENLKLALKQSKICTRFLPK